MRLRELLAAVGAWPIDEEMEKEPEMEFKIFFENLHYAESLVEITEIEFIPVDQVIVLRG